MSVVYPKLAVIGCGLIGSSVIRAARASGAVSEVVVYDASPAHRGKCAEKLARIRVQRADLATCLAELLADVVARRRTFSVYFQFKMYNDPALNPQLYRSAGPA